MSITFEVIEGAVPPEELRATGMDAYENCANYAAKVLLRAARRDPQAFGAALDAYRLNPYGHDVDALLTGEEQAMLFEGRWALSGFMWGWAVGTVAFLLEQAPVPNGAIVTIRRLGGEG